MCTRGSRTSAAPTSPSPGQQRQRVRRHARLAQRAHEHERAAGRLLGRLEHDRVAGRQPGGDHPARDRDREVPRRDHGDDAARPVAERVALARHLQQLRAGLELDRPARVVLEEVDRLAHVGVGLGPRLGALAHLERGDLEPVLAQPRGGAHEHRGALGGRPPAPVAVTGARGLERGVDLARAWPRRRARRRGRARPGRSRRSRRRCAGPSPTQTGTSSGPRASCSLSAAGEAGAHGRAAQLQHRLVGERGRGWSSCGADALSGPGPAVPISARVSRLAGIWRLLGGADARVRSAAAGLDRVPDRGRPGGVRRHAGARSRHQRPRGAAGARARLLHDGRRARALAHAARGRARLAPGGRRRDGERRGRRRRAARRDAGLLPAAAARLRVLRHRRGGCVSDLVPVRRRASCSCSPSGSSPRRASRSSSARRSRASSSR